MGRDAPPRGGPCTDCFGCRAEAMRLALRDIRKKKKKKTERQKLLKSDPDVMSTAMTVTAQQGVVAVASVRCLRQERRPPAALFRGLTIPR